MTKNGIDEVELVGSTLSDGPLYPLRKIASGGELSTFDACVGTQYG